MDRIECSVWNNGGMGWGLTVLGGLYARRLHFRRQGNPIFVDLDGTLFPVNIDKDGFWTRSCPHLISVALLDYEKRDDHW